ncbi:hypothetical protein K469DRAFT_294905 [Zopfia rhizophila CBS 207.26]|uniref:Uncharacterized protein n=1 Tax=Zopfia rhizophila CBS 207.26 TaxID=1314779 RepID=A0A6A6DKW9_9PEZI|nr:hypothetical protein K469DRAFT_294905 [Zopfia rhizophila CBS 207.26]
MTKGAQKKKTSRLQNPLPELCTYCTAPVNGHRVVFQAHLLCNRCYYKTEDPDSSQFAGLDAKVEHAFQTGNMTSFPYLPRRIAVCKRSDCVRIKADEGSLRACTHDVERLLRESGKYDSKFPKLLRSKWHPDKVSNLLCGELPRGRRCAGEANVPDHPGAL